MVPKQIELFSSVERTTNALSALDGNQRDVRSLRNSGLRIRGLLAPTIAASDKTRELNPDSHRGTTRICTRCGPHSYPANSDEVEQLVGCGRCTRDEPRVQKILEGDRR